jgi:nucleotide-binding universal stress UspA family protein
MVLHVIDQRLLEPAITLSLEAKADALLTRLHQRAREQYPPLVAGLERPQVEFELLLVDGNPFLKIVQFARDLDVDLIVMSVHRGPAHFEQFLFGSTAERVMRVAPCPVLIVPETAILNEA